MDKLKHKTLIQWLQKQSVLGKSWLVMTISLAFISGLLLVAQAGLLAHLLHEIIMSSTPANQLTSSFVGLAFITIFRAICTWGKEQTGYRAGQAVRKEMRKLVLNKLDELGSTSIQGKPAGAWASLVLEQIEEMQDFFARYLPQMAIALFIPLIILCAVFPINWAAGLIFLLTAPLVPLFMALVGMGAADANRRNFKALQRLSGHFYDRLKGLPTLKLFNQIAPESAHLKLVSDEFRKRTMDVLRIAFLSSAVLEFFTALSIAITAVYFGFSFIGELNFGHYGLEITLFVAVFVLVLAPEFYQPLRDLGTFYHAKAQAIGAAESLVEFINSAPVHALTGTTPFAANEIQLRAEKWTVFSPEGDIVLVGPLDFTIAEGEKIALIGHSGAGKTSLINGLLGFLPYEGSLKINGIELRDIQLDQWRSHISWVGQNPQLFHGTLRDNIGLSNPNTPDTQLMNAAKQAHADEFIQQLDKGLDHLVGDRMAGLSVGQAQRIALARALLQNGAFWLLDEPTASLDANSEQCVTTSLAKATTNKTTLFITHRLDQLEKCDNIWVLSEGKFIQSGHYQALKDQGEFAQMIQMADRSDVDA